MRDCQLSTWSPCEEPGIKKKTRNVINGELRGGITCGPTLETTCGECELNCYFLKGNGDIAYQNKVLNGAGGAGGIIINNNGTVIEPLYPSLNGTGPYSIQSPGFAGIGFGEGGGGHPADSTGQVARIGGPGGNGFCLISYNDVNYFIILFLFLLILV